MSGWSQLSGNSRYLSKECALACSITCNLSNDWARAARLWSSEVRGVHEWEECIQMRKHTNQQHAINSLWWVHIIMLGSIPKGAGTMVEWLKCYFYQPAINSMQLLWHTSTMDIMYHGTQSRSRSRSCSYPYHRRMVICGVCSPWSTDLLFSSLFWYERGGKSFKLRRPSALT